MSPTPNGPSPLVQAALMILVALTGALVAFQPSMNARLQGHLGHQLFGALTNNLVGFSGVLLLTLLIRPRLELSGAGAAPWWAWLGGLCGATFVVTSLSVVGRLGVAVFFTTLLAGQLIMSGLIDHFGWVGQEARRMNPGRAAGIALAIAGVVVARLSTPSAGPGSDSGETATSPAESEAPAAVQAEPED